MNKGMIVIEDVKWYETERDRVQYHEKQPMPDLSTIGTDPMNDTVTFEYVVGREFVCMKEGKVDRIKIGMTQKVQDILQLPYDAFASMENEINVLHNQRVDLSQKLTIATDRMGRQIEELEKQDVWLRAWEDKFEEVSKWSWWRRLKFLFKGKL